MTSTRPLRLSVNSPSGLWSKGLLAVAFLVVSACATSAPRPPAPISTGGPRVEPVVEPVDAAEEEVIEQALTEEEIEEALAEGVTPPHMIGRDIVRAAVLLPFSHPNRNVRAEAEGLLAGIEMGLFDHGDENFLIVPKDTAGQLSKAEAGAIEAVNDGADIILGPLFAANVQAVARVAETQDVPVLAFSNDRRAAGGNAWLASVSPEEEVARIMAFARLKGIESFAFLGPDSGYGRRVEAAMRFQAAGLGAQMIASGFYDPSNDAPTDEANAVAATVQAEATRIPERVAVLIPERGVKLRAVAPLLPYFGVDTRYVTMLGTSRWNDETVWREPTLIGGYFPTAPVADAEKYGRDFARIYGKTPTALSSLGYDAAALAAALADPEGYDREQLGDPDGFRGVNGLFRFRSDGTAERGLAVMQVTGSEEGAVEVEAAPESFLEDVF